LTKFEYSIVIPVYKNSANIPSLLQRATEIENEFSKQGILIEFIFVVDGCPEGSYEILKTEISKNYFSSKLYKLNRNVGSAQAIKFGLNEADGKYVAVMAADLQEPAELFADMYFMIKESGDGIVFASRKKRNDGFISNSYSAAYWKLWSMALNKKIPSGGMDVFCMTQEAKKRFTGSSYKGTALIAALLDLNLPYSFVPYERSNRDEGESAWTLKKKLRMVSDSVYGFTDLPLRLINYIGVGGIVVSIVLGLIVVVGKLLGKIDSPGFAALITTILFTNSLLIIAISIATNYIWRIFLNSKGDALFFSIDEFKKGYDN
jgi:glycosyltransferase involved in cell wall biosynthesis